MTALACTIQRERAGHWSKASPSVSLSFHENQRGRAFARGLSRARGHGVVRVDHVVEADRISSRSALTLLLPVNWPGLRVRSLYVRRAGSTRTRDHSINGSGCRPSVGNRLPHQRLVDHTADRLHHLSDLSYAPSFDGSKKPWKWRQELGKVIQGRGYFVQGGGCSD